MSEKAECPRGGMQGILVTDDELVEFATKLKKKHIDEVIPLPNLSVIEQTKALKECKKHSDDAEYWESESGSHGWCCPKCGAVLQWG